MTPSLPLRIKQCHWSEKETLENQLWLDSFSFLKDHHILLTSLPSALSHLAYLIATHMIHDQVHAFVPSVQYQHYPTSSCIFCVYLHVSSWSLSFLSLSFLLPINPFISLASLFHKACTWLGIGHLLCIGSSQWIHPQRKFTVYSRASVHCQQRLCYGIPPAP